MWRFLQENLTIFTGTFGDFWFAEKFDDVCRKTYWLLQENMKIFQKNLVICGHFLYKNFTILARKFDVFYKKVCRFLQKNWRSLQEFL